MQFLDTGESPDHPNPWITFTALPRIHPWSPDARRSAAATFLRELRHNPPPDLDVSAPHGLPA